MTARTSTRLFSIFAIAFCFSAHVVAQDFIVEESGEEHDYQVEWPEPASFGLVPPPVTIPGLSIPHPSNLQDPWIVQDSGSSAWGELWTLFAPNQSELRKPLLIVEGIDLDNNMGWYEIYPSLAQEGLDVAVRAEDFDIVLLNFGDALRRIEENAGVVIAAIQELISRRVGSEPLVVLGASMGGLVARYALTYMEYHGVSHQTRLFISFDAPQTFANVPIGLQYMIKFFSPYDGTAQDKWNKLNRPAVKQMLYYHPEVSCTGCDRTLRENLFGSLAAMGNYPGIRKVAISNGALSTSQLFPPGAAFLEMNYTGSYAWVASLPDSPGSPPPPGECPEPTPIVFHGIVSKVLGYDENGEPLVVGYKELRVLACWTHPFDTAQGGTRQSFDGFPGATIFNDAHTFIPTVSALGISTSDPTYVQGTPAFDRVKVAAAHEPHLYVSSDTKQWIMDELTDAVAPPEVEVVYPNGSPGQLFTTGTTVNITWRVNDVNPTLTKTDIYLLHDPPPPGTRSLWGPPLGTNQSANSAGDGSYAWTIPYASILNEVSGLHDDMKIFVLTRDEFGTVNQVADESDATFQLDLKERVVDNEEPCRYGDSCKEKQIPLAPGLFLTARSENPSTQGFSLAVRAEGEQSLDAKVYDLRGRLVRTLVDPHFPFSGTRLVAWDAKTDTGRNAAAGVYLVVLESGGQRSSYKVAILH